MARRVSYKLSTTEWTEAYTFYQALKLNISFEDFAAQCLAYTMSKCRQEATELQRQKELADGNTTSGNTTGDSTASQSSEVTGSTVAADSTTSSDQATIAE